MKSSFFRRLYGLVKSTTLAKALQEVGVSADGRLGGFESEMFRMCGRLGGRYEGGRVRVGRGLCVAGGKKCCMLSVEEV